MNLELERINMLRILSVFLLFSTFFVFSEENLFQDPEEPLLALYNYQLTTIDPKLKEKTDLFCVVFNEKKISDELLSTLKLHEPKFISNLGCYNLLHKEKIIVFFIDNLLEHEDNIIAFGGYYEGKTVKSFAYELKKIKGKWQVILEDDSRIY